MGLRQPILSGIDADCGRLPKGSLRFFRTTPVNTSDPNPRRLWEGFGGSRTDTIQLGLGFSDRLLSPPYTRSTLYGLSSTSRGSFGSPSHVSKGSLGATCNGWN